MRRRQPLPSSNDAEAGDWSKRKVVEARCLRYSLRRGLLCGLLCSVLTVGAVALWIQSDENLRIFVNGGGLLDLARDMDGELLWGLIEEAGIRKKSYAYKREDPRFQGASCDEAPVRVAVVGGGVAGLTAAHSLVESNRARRCAPGSRPTNAAPLFNVTLFEKAERIGGHAHTVMFPLAAGGTYPVDAGFAWTPLIRGYQKLRRFYRKYGLNLTGPLHNSVEVFKPDFKQLTREEHESHDRECGRLLAILDRLAKQGGARLRVVLGLITLRAFWEGHGFSDAFFMERVYPLIRFIIISGSKGHMLDAPAFCGLNMFFNGWMSCYQTSLHGTNWYNVAGGSEEELRVFARLLEGSLRMGAEVKEVSEPDGRGQRTVDYWSKELGAVKSEVFDAVVLAGDPHDYASVLGKSPPPWLPMVTYEETSVAVHSDERVMGPPESGANTAYIIPAAGAAYGYGSLSMYWDSTHGDTVAPRPIVTYGAEFWARENETTFRGEVARIRFRHTTYPNLRQAVLMQKAVAEAHGLPDASLFFAGSWVVFAYDHNGGFKTGWETAFSLGARPDKEEFFMTGPRFGDYPGWEERCEATRGGLFPSRA